MYLDDLTPGFTFSTPERELSEAEILAFARQWDPQPFHTDPEAAKVSIYGGLIASGFQTILISFGQTLEAGIWNEASMGSPGMETLEWSKPVRPGDRLRTEGEVLSVTPSTSRPDRGRALIRYVVFNQDGEVARYTTTHILKRRG